ncbi:MAG TPA: M12 family metallo-peptidase [Pyrinomonadaceae bacterium]|jgi:subtilisin-like proprotein convertase family protein|nr:M12 family metallo-peptidase [Pyrinomonadaceae bacterium]
MKRTSLVLLIVLAFSSFCLLYFEPSKAQTKPSDEDSLHKQPAPFSKGADKLKQVPQMIKNSKSAGAHFDRRELFQSAANTIDQYATDATGNDAQLRKVISHGTVLNLNKAAIENILTENAGFLTLPLPDGKGATIELELVKVNIFAPGFTVKTSKPTTNKSINESLGIHYRGIVKGNDRSLAVISIFKNEVMGFFSTEVDGNFTVGRVGGNNPIDKHILYAEKDLKVRSKFHCETKDPEGPLPVSSLLETDAVLARCVRIYIEANYDLFLNKGSVANTTSYLTGMFNQSAALFSNDGVPVSLSEIFVWNSPSPYTGGDSNTVLSQFRSNRTTFNGDLAHLVSLQNYGGLATSINGLCNRSLAYDFSGIEPNYNTVPTYSWSVYVFTHEMGHTLGSRHTHACVWNGNDTAIDGCGPTAGFPYEGSCSGAPVPPNGGTIMSYCHQLQNVGINFTLGFGPQPRNVIVNVFNSSTCLLDCGGGGGCTYSLSPTSQSFAAAGGSGSFSVTTGSTCSWAATVNAPSLPGNSSPSPQANLLSSAGAATAQPGAANTPAAPQSLFLNSTPITVNDRSSNSNPPATGSLYPSTINISGMTGTITQVTASLNDLSHTFPDDVDVLLVGPTGQRVILMSDAGGSFDVSGVTLTFDQSAAALPDETQIVSGNYRPSNFNTSATLEPGGVDNFPAPAPGQTTYGSDLNVFNGAAPNGTWQLYVVDDEAGDSGNIATGWALGITTSSGGTSWINITSGASGTGNGVVNYTVAANGGTSQRTGTITVNGQVHNITQAGTGGGCPSTPISPGQTINGSLTTADCIFSGTTRYVDVYGFNGAAGQRVAVSMNSSAFDTYLYLVNSSGQVIAEDDDGGGSSNSRIPAASGFFTLPAAGNYSIWASSFSANSTGAYSISLVNETATTLRIDSVTPKAGRTGGGQAISLSGAFAGLSTVTIGGTSVAWNYTSGTSVITFNSPAHAVGAVGFVLTPTSGSTLTRSNAFAYLPTVFTDDTLVAGVTTAKAQHIVELRQAVDALRAVAGLPAAQWTDTILVGTFIRAVHIQELRTSLEQAAQQLGYPAAAYTDPSLAGVSVKRIHIEELRQRIRNIAG